MLALPWGIMRKRIEAVKYFIGELNTIAGIRQANKVGRAKAYNGIPDIINK